MKSVKYKKVDTLPEGAVKLSIYAQMIGQRHPSYLCVAYDRYLQGKTKDPGYTIINWQEINFIIPNNQ